MHHTIPTEYWFIRLLVYWLFTFVKSHAVHKNEKIVIFLKFDPYLMAKLIVDIDDNLHKKLKHEAIDKEITLRQLVVEKLS